MTRLDDTQPDQGSSAPPRGVPPARLSRFRLGRALVGLTAAALLGEVVLRLAWGFGTPVLYEWDARFEYRMVPNQSVRRFGRAIQTNSLGLRCREFPVHRTDPNELRVLIVGDSVVNGGSHVDQAELGTARLERLLADFSQRPVVVINASANSWGPPNQLAFMEAYGTFDADVAIVVLSSHDLVDVPNNTQAAQSGSGDTFNRPWCAWSEVAGLAWSRLVPASLPSPPSEDDSQRAEASLAALRSLLSTLTRQIPRVAVAFHWDRDEQANGVPRPAHSRLLTEVQSLGLPTWELGPAFIEAAKDGAPRMHDRIHPTSSGQALLASELLRRMQTADWLPRAPAR